MSGLCDGRNLGIDDAVGAWYGHSSGLECLRCLNLVEEYGGRFGVADRGEGIGEEGFHPGGDFDGGVAEWQQDVGFELACDSNDVVDDTRVVPGEALYNLSGGCQRHLGDKLVAYNLDFGAETASAFLEELGHGHAASAAEHEDGDVSGVLHRL